MNQIIEQPIKVNEDFAPPKDSSLTQVIYLLTQTIAMSQQEEKKRELTSKKEKKANIAHSWQITIVTLMVSLLGLGFTVYQFKVENEQKRRFQAEQQMQVQINQQIQSLDDQIHDKIVRRDGLNKAMAKIRNLIETGHLYCKNDQYLGDINIYNEKKFHDLYEMITANYLINQVFDSNIFKYSQDFLYSAVNYKNACGENEDFDKKLRLTQREINKLMADSILIDKLKKEKLIKKLKSSLPHSESELL